MVDLYHSVANLKMSVVIDSVDQHMINTKCGILKTNEILGLHINMAKWK